jgi:hypothetical protein
MARRAGEVAELQTSLGELHDCDGWLEGLGRMLRGFQERADGMRLTAMERQKQSAAVWLLGHFARARTKHFNQALTRWHEWETGNFFALVEASLNNTSQASPGGAA